MLFTNSPLCLLADRAKLWSNTMLPQLFNSIYCSDGFFLNLCSVMLRLCTPFSAPQSPRLLKVQPTYCLATKGQPQDVRNRNIHIVGKCLWMTHLMKLTAIKETFWKLKPAEFWCQSCIILGWSMPHILPWRMTFCTKKKIASNTWKLPS